jgi:hypothetical protein
MQKVERWSAAVHEAGHSTVAHIATGATVHALDILPGLCDGHPCNGRTRLIMTACEARSPTAARP